MEPEILNTLIGVCATAGLTAATALLRQGKKIAAADAKNEERWSNNDRRADERQQVLLDRQKESTDLIRDHIVQAEAQGRAVQGQLNGHEVRIVRLESWREISNVLHGIPTIHPESGEAAA